MPTVKRVGTRSLLAYWANELTLAYCMSVVPVVSASTGSHCTTLETCSKPSAGHPPQQRIPRCPPDGRSESLCSRQREATVLRLLTGFTSFDQHHRHDLDAACLSCSTCHTSMFPCSYSQIPVVSLCHFSYRMPKIQKEGFCHYHSKTQF